MNKSWRHHPTRHQLYGHLPPITKTIKVRRARHAGHCWRSKDELVSDVLLWTPAYGQAKAGRPARTYIQQLCEDTGCNPEDLPKAMNDWEKWRERVRDIRAGGTTWWWWWWYIYIYIYIYIYNYFYLITRICLHSVIRFQVFSLYRDNLRLYGIEYCYRIRIILSKFIWPIDGIHTGNSFFCLSGLGNNLNKEVVYTFQISRTGASPLDAVKCHTQNISFLKGLNPLHRIQTAYYKPHRQCKWQQERKLGK